MNLSVEEMWTAYNALTWAAKEYYFFAEASKYGPRVRNQFLRQQREAQVLADKLGDELGA